MDDRASRNQQDLPESVPPETNRAKWGVAELRRRWGRKLLWAGGMLFVFIAVTMGSAEYWTGQPAFCRSCHVMEPYWKSWNHDVHGQKLGVRCVDCHYAPGERLTFHAKFKGLSQATSYFSGRFGGSRPRAHVNDKSCLVSECHGDHKFLDKKLPIGEARAEKRFIGETVTQVQRTPTVTFVHSTHLGIDRKLADNESQLKQVTDRLKKAASSEVFELIEKSAVFVGPRAEQTAKLKTELAARNASDLLEPATELVRLQDLQGRLTQLAGLTCASCHGYDPSGTGHFAVDLQTCYTCHFTNQTFNGETGRCLNCHEPPTRQILVHGVPASQGAGPSIMDHQDILKRNIDCVSCHLDVVQGKPQVTVQECARCHDRSSYAKDFENRTIDTVKEYHRVHVAAQRARCPDCHHAVTHELIEPTLVATSAGFVKPILDECQHCHPDHHREQVELLMGVGGEGITQPMPNAMFGSRVNCRACHTKPGTDFKGTPLIAATAETCVACHEQKYGDLLHQWLGEISSYLTESEKAMELVRKRMEEQRAAGTAIPDRVEELVGMAAHNLHLVRIGNGIHNKNFAAHLLDVSDDYLREAMDLLARPPAATAPSGA